MRRGKLGSASRQKGAAIQTRNPNKICKTHKNEGNENTMRATSSNNMSGSNNFNMPERWPGNKRLQPSCNRSAPSC